MSYTYDGLCRVCNRRTADLNTGVTDERFSYDAASNVLDDDCVYDTHNRLTSFKGESITYDADGNMTCSFLNDQSVNLTFDSRNRLISDGIHTYTYNAENTRIRSTCNGVETSCTYNTNAKLNQLLVKRTTGVITKYVYGLGLIGEEKYGEFKTYHFDYRGSTVAITNAAGAVTDTFAYDTYGKLTGYDGQTITYDDQGNPLSYLGHTLTWEKGRQLKSFDGITYTYNANGIRTSKTVDGVTHTYLLDGTKIHRETWGTNTLIPLYNNEDEVCGILYNDTPFYFLKNQQGDIISITDRSGANVAKYSYDAWGVCTVTEDTSEIGIASINPFRYRGYYYDAEIGLYYLQSRYYNPVVGTFANEDDSAVIFSNQTIIGYNLFCYCDNCCVNGVDFFGYAFTGNFWNYVNSLPIVAGVRNFAGFSWDSKQGIWYSQMNPIQRKFGYCDLYDSLAPLAAIFIDHKKMPFWYNGNGWMVWLWKGQYGITTGAEIGLYVYSPKSLIERTIRQKWYRCANNNERIKMSFTLYKNGKRLFYRPYQTHWWLTGFKPGIKLWWEKLSMYITLGFHNLAMARAFCSANKLNRPSSSKVSFWW